MTKLLAIATLAFGLAGAAFSTPAVAADQTGSRNDCCTATCCLNPKDSNGRARAQNRSSRATPSHPKGTHGQF